MLQHFIVSTIHYFHGSTLQSFKASTHQSFNCQLRKIYIIQSFLLFKDCQSSLSIQVFLKYISGIKDGSKWAHHTQPGSALDGGKKN
jgi:hypothetical protein